MQGRSWTANYIDTRQKREGVPLAFVSASMRIYGKRSCTRRKYATDILCCSCFGIWASLRILQIPSSTSFIIRKPICRKPYQFVKAKRSCFRLKCEGNALFTALSRQNKDSGCHKESLQKRLVLLAQTVYNKFRKRRMANNCKHRQANKRKQRLTNDMNGGQYGSKRLPGVKRSGEEVEHIRAQSADTLCGGKDPRCCPHGTGLDDPQSRKETHRRTNQGKPSSAS